MPFLVTMRYKCVILVFCILFFECEKICIKAASLTTTNSKDKCPKKTEVECQELNLYCCVKPPIVGQCCSEQEYFDQVRIDILEKL